MLRTTDHRLTLTMVLICLLVPALKGRADNSFPNYFQINNRANSLSPADIPVLTEKAEGGDATSQILLGLAYQNGHGVRENHGAALQWYRKAAEQGTAMGENLLGLAYATGMGITENGAEAVIWFRKAAAQGDYTAEDNLEISLKNGVSLPKKAAEAYAKVERAATDGESAAQIALGLSYAGKPNRLGVHKDYEKGATWLKKASDTGSPIAQANLAALYYVGKGVPKDEAEGLKLLLKAAEKRYSEALYFLGQINEHGQGVPKDKLTADMFYLLAEDSGKVIFDQRHGNIFTGGIALFSDHGTNIEDRQKARKLADEWKTAHPQ